MTIPAKKNRAFTLTELLIVIAIIALLMAIMVPTLSLARKKSKALVCASGMRQISIAFRNYANYNNNRIIKASKIMNASNPWIWALLPYIDGDTDKSNSWDKPAELWFCPSDKDPYPIGYAPHGQQYTSYAPSGYYKEASKGGGWSSPTPEIRLGAAGGYKFSQISQPSKCMHIAETSYYGQIYDAENPKVSPFRLEKEGHHRNTSGFYHSGEMNVIFVDGHVNSVKGRKVNPVKPPPGLIKTASMFWNDIALPDSQQNPAFWGPGY